jgi:hypothetical protein
MKYKRHCKEGNFYQLTTFASPLNGVGILTAHRQPVAMTTISYSATKPRSPISAAFLSLFYAIEVQQTVKRIIFIYVFIYLFTSMYLLLLSLNRISPPPYNSAVEVITCKTRSFRCGEFKRDIVFKGPRNWSIGNSGLTSRIKRCVFRDIQITIN